MTDVKLYKMSGAGNDFVVLDGRGKDMDEFRRAERIRELCKEFRTDGLMILLEGMSLSGRKAETGFEGSQGWEPQGTLGAEPLTDHTEFRMEFYNPDGSGGMMCGNGGRCIVAFADWLGITPLEPGHYHFLAPDGPHSAEILSRPYSGCGKTATGKQWIVRLGMIDVNGIRKMLGGYFLNTGTRHFVKFVEDVDAIDIETDGKALRWNEAFAPEGTNVNFVQRLPDGTLKIRTFEKGVEGETLACGTGITAAAIAAFAASYPDSDGECRYRPPFSGARTSLFPVADEIGRISIRLQARRGDILQVDFQPEGTGIFRDIHLTGPAEFC